MNHDEVIREFMLLPGIAERSAEKLYEVDMHSIEDLRKMDPEEVYGRLLAKDPTSNRVWYYVLRAVSYYLSVENADPEKTKWQYWKD